MHNLLKKHAALFCRVSLIDYRNEPHAVLDLSRNNPELTKIDCGNPEALSEYIKKHQGQAKYSLGKYLEDREIYDHSTVFSGEDRRTVHLGIDLWVPAGTVVLAPLDATVHSFKNNKGKGDYGPTIILEHELEGQTFYTLYGHLSTDSLDGLKEGQQIPKGTSMGKIGNYPENGNWPTHLHFQIIIDMDGKKGDYPGVCTTADIAYYTKNCPDPNLILQIPGL